MTLLSGLIIEKCCLAVGFYLPLCLEVGFYLPLHPFFYIVLEEYGIAPR